MDEKWYMDTTYMNENNVWTLYSYEYVGYSDWYTNKSVVWWKNDVWTLYSYEYGDYSDFYTN